MTWLKQMMNLIKQDFLGFLLLFVDFVAQGTESRDKFIPALCSREGYISDFSTFGESEGSV
jgi:hypothetical protein